MILTMMTRKRSQTKLVLFFLYFDTVLVIWMSYFFLDEESFVCFHCGNKYKSKLVLALHIRTKHSSVQRKVREHVCEGCDRAFSTKRVLQSHLSKCDRRIKNGVDTDSVEILEDKSLKVVQIEAFPEKGLGRYLSIVGLLLIYCCS